MTPPAEQELQVPLKQLIYHGAVIDVDWQSGGALLKAEIPGCGELHIFALATERAQEVGRKLTAPRLHAVGSGNGNGKAG